MGLLSIILYYRKYRFNQLLVAHCGAVDAISCLGIEWLSLRHIASHKCHQLLIIQATQLGAFLSAVSAGFMGTAVYQLWSYRREGAGDVEG